MTKKGNKYPLIPESVYWKMVQNNESYNGFVEYEDGVFSFVLSQSVVNKRQITKSIGDYTESVMDVNTQYSVFKPLR